MSATLPEHDPVDHPSHYMSESGIECIDAIEAAFTPEEVSAFLRINTFKYLWRAGKKGDILEDLKKGLWYLDREVWGREDRDKPEETGDDKTPECTEDTCYCPEAGLCRDYIRLHAQKAYREGMERAGMKVYGPGDDVPVVILSFDAHVPPSVTACFSDECSTSDDCSVDCCDEALTESPHRSPDRSDDRADAVAMGSSRLLRFGRKRTRVR